MLSVPRENYIYAMSKDNPAVLTVPSGAGLCFETNDALHGQVMSDGQSISALDWERVNPATGPVAVEGAEPGDAIKVNIEQIEISGMGIMAALPGLGIFSGSITEGKLKIMPVLGDQIEFGYGINLPIRPMIGVIGTAPAGEAIPCGTPGSHGGNMDCKKIAPGSVLYLPVFHPGGLLAMGDLHAAMGDGEVMGTGVEVSGKVWVTVNLIKGLYIPDPLLETRDMIYSIASADTLENASLKAAGNIREMVVSKLGLDPETAGMLMSAAGQLEICQVVDPLMTVRFGMPKEYVM